MPGFNEKKFFPGCLDFAFPPITAVEAGHAADAGRQFFLDQSLGKFFTDGTAGGRDEDHVAFHERSWSLALKRLKTRSPLADWVILTRPEELSAAVSLKPGKA